ncbi:anti-sigma factor domain-containing protein [Rubeoparvulum massiliense]|uniref:anti-sigma factor domain-containing protein n=1 Tax=Rubeoparvulum massiliense TaxID=1631346 RepID=UPI00065E74C1|nr:anti-sigma factor domain-containing protein [Rubeoparvulum massiliense]
MTQGCVLKKQKKWIIIMTTDGEVLRIPNKGSTYQVGQIVQLSPIQLAASREEHSTQHFRNWKKAIPLVVAAVLFLTLATWISTFQPIGEVAAYVTLDVNPSIEIGVDDRQRVVNWTPLNKDGEQLLQNAKVRKGIELQSLLQQLLQQMQADGVLKDSILYSSTILPDNNDTHLESALEETLTSTLEKLNQDEAKSIVPVIVQGDSSIREGAYEEQISTGRYILYLQAQEEKEEGITIEEWREIPVKDLITHANSSHDKTAASLGESDISDDEQGDNLGILTEPKAQQKLEKEQRKQEEKELKEELKQEKKEQVNPKNNKESPSQKEQDQGSVKKDKDKKNDKAGLVDPSRKDQEKTDKKLEKELEKQRKEQEKKQKDREKEQKKWDNSSNRLDDDQDKLDDDDDDDHDDDEDDEDDDNYDYNEEYRH